ncbi:BtrH N-terminal domain-containing protein [Halobacteriaceae archaeon GCM10025711]
MRVSGYVHAPGDHCGSASLRNLATFYDWGFDEPLCFGLGAGLGFGYYESGPASRMIMGRNAGLESSFFDHLELAHEDRSGQDTETAWAAVTDRLSDDVPVVLFVDLYYLGYFGTDTHFGPHTLVIVGAEGDEVMLSDSEFDDPQRIPRADLFDAWNSEHGFTGPLTNRWLAVTDPDPGVAVPEAARRSVRRTADVMLDGGDVGWGGEGVAAIRAFADDLPDWRTFPDASWTARFAYQNVERRGTGGGAFRRLYADFLDQVASDLDLPASLPDRMHDVADDWTTLGRTLRDASEREGDAMADALTDAADQTHHLADREEALFTDLRDAV